MYKDRNPAGNKALGHPQLSGMVCLSCPYFIVMYSPCIVSVSRFQHWRTQGKHLHGCHAILRLLAAKKTWLELIDDMFGLCGDFWRIWFFPRIKKSCQNLQKHSKRDTWPVSVFLVWSFHLKFNECHTLFGSIFASLRCSLLVESSQMSLKRCASYVPVYLTEALMSAKVGHNVYVWDRTIQSSRNGPHVFLSDTILKARHHAQR